MLRWWSLWVVFIRKNPQLRRGSDGLMGMVYVTGIDGWCFILKKSSPQSQSIHIHIHTMGMVILSPTWIIQLIIGIHVGFDYTLGQHGSRLCGKKRACFLFFREFLGVFWWLKKPIQSGKTNLCPIFKKLLEGECFPPDFLGAYRLELFFSKAEKVVFPRRPDRHRFQWNPDFLHAFL